MKKSLSILTTLAMAASLGTVSTWADNASTAVSTIHAQYGHASYTPQFGDVGRNHWAIRYITEMSVKGVISGMGNDTFAPSANVTNEQAIIMTVRAMGLSGQAQALGTNATVNLKDAQNVDSWARPYVALAQQKGFLDTGITLNPKQPAQREWVTELVVRAAGLQSEAIAHQQDTLTYHDAASIDPSDVGYISVATSEGIIHGTPDGNFMPHDPLQRSQMAVILCNAIHLFDYNTDQQTQSQGDLNGKITAVSDSGISLQTPTGTVSYTFASQYYVFVGEQMSSESHLQTGMWAHILLNPQGQIVFVQAQPVAPSPGQVNKTALGTVTAFQAPTGSGTGSITIHRTVGMQPVTDDSQTQLNMTFTIAPNASVTFNGSSSTFDAIKPGCAVTLSINDNAVVAIAARTQVAQPIDTPPMEAQPTSTGL